MDTPHSEVITASEVADLTHAVVALLVALAGWLAYQSSRHEKKLNGTMSDRIINGANEAIAADRDARSEKTTPTRAERGGLR